MDPEIVKKLIDVCFIAKRITELTPPLPPGMAPRHNHVIDAIQELSAKKEDVFISDISKKLNITTPSVTKMVGQLEEMGYLIKIFNQEDKRFVSLKLTDAGEAHYKTFVESYHNDLASLMQDMSDEDCLSTVNTINTFYEKIKTYTDEVKYYETF